MKESANKPSPFEKGLGGSLKDRKEMTTEFKNKRVTIFGAGKSGMASARKLVSLGALVTITEVKKELEPKILQELTNLRVRLELGGHTASSFEKAELIVLSPGVHLDLPLLEEARKKGIPIISEIELAYQFLSKPIIAVTGTNGKTTTTTLIGEMLKAGGKKIAVAGNIGNPLVEVNDSELDFVVVEVSSYQLEAINCFRPWISVILNLQPDHLERHHSLEEYLRQKARIFQNQKEDDYLVYNLEDAWVAKMVQPAQAKLVGFSWKRIDSLPLRPEEIKIPGRHNLENSLAAATVADLCGISQAKVAEVLRNFPGVEHRIEYVRTVKGVEFYNDSKATNPDSTMVALDAFPGREIVLILGGRDKGVELAGMMQKVKEKVKAVVLIGEAAAKFAEALRAVGYENFHHAGFSMEEAVKKAFALALPGGLVLLSPACASFDMYCNFEERGKDFKRICQKLEA
jgi:UDP-N-acetylmuramoylalanine--D-glutamate ligase